MRIPDRMPRPARILTGFALAAALLAAHVAAAEESSAIEAESSVLAPAQTIAWSAAATSALDDTFVVKKPNFGRAALEVFGANALVWTYNRFIREGGTNPVFRIGFNSWSENLQAGYNWDDNSFSTNQIAHPYHGNLYFNAARSNGYSFWQSAPFAFAGSFMWEYFGETHNPSYNDWIATSVGGIALGEILHRLAGTVRDNTATGSSRNWKEVGGLFLDPVGGLNRIIDGDWSRQYANSPDRFPKNYTTHMDVGLRTRGEDKVATNDTTDFYLEFGFDYGDPFFGDLGKPYDSFDFEFQLNFGDKTKMGRVQSSGNLAGMFLKESEKTDHILAAYQRYDYVNTNALEVGGQSFTAALLSRWAWDSGFELRTDVQLGPMLLGGSSSDYESISGRSYDYGPGTVARIGAELRRKGWTWLMFRTEHFWIHSISGNPADHHVVLSRLRLAVPIIHNIGAGAEYYLALADRKYSRADMPDVKKRNPQAKVFLTFGLN